MNSDNEQAYKDGQEDTRAELLESDEARVPDEEVKMKINNIIWMHGSPRLTLVEAEDMACEFFGKLTDSWYKK